MSERDLVVLGTASQAPTRRRNHNGYLLRFDEERILFDPGEGTQRQLAFAGEAAAQITRICITHFHGDHCLGLPGIVQRLGLDRPADHEIALRAGYVERDIPVHYPAGQDEHYERLRHASASYDRSPVVAAPAAPGVVAETPVGTLSAAWLDHLVPALGYRLAEPDGRRMLPEALAAAGVEGPAVGRLIAEGVADIDGRRVRVEDVSAPRRGQVVAFVMDTAWCDAAVDLARDADLLVAEATFRDEHAELATAYGHLTAGQAGRLAAEAGARHLVLTHFSERYRDVEAHVEEAAAVFDGEITAAEDLDRIPLPPRHR
jgi:ribonuclease Z